MFNSKKVITVTPTGRMKFLKLLLKYILDNKHIIDEHHFWINTNDEEVKAYIEGVCDADRKFFKAIPCDVPISDENPILSIHSFYKNCISDDTIYIKIDDDICFIQEGTIEKVVAFREKHKEYFVISPIVINNFMFYKIQNVPYENTKDKNLGVWMHSMFLDNYPNLPPSCDFDYLEIGQERPRININLICWFGSDFKKFGGIMDDFDDEEWISLTKPALLNKKNAIVGNTLACHYSFHWQIIDDFIYESYKNIAFGDPKIIKRRNISLI